MLGSSRAGDRRQPLAREARTVLQARDLQKEVWDPLGNPPRTLRNLPGKPPRTTLGNPAPLENRGLEAFGSNQISARLDFVPQVAQ